MRGNKRENPAVPENYHPWVNYCNIYGTEAMQALTVIVAAIQAARTGEVVRLAKVLVE